MKYLFSFFLILMSVSGFAQSGFSFGAGYSATWLKAVDYTAFLTQVNDANAGLTKPFDTDDLHQGYSLFAGSKTEKSFFIFSYQQIFNKSTAEGVIPVVSSDPGKFEISTRHSSVSMVYDHYFLPFFAIGGQFGYTYSTIRNAQYELAFGDSKSVVDKKGGLQAGINAIIEIPLGSSAYFQVQPYYMLPFYDMDMDNIATIYLGQGNSAATASDIRGMGIEVKLGINVQ